MRRLYEDAAFARDEDRRADQAHNGPTLLWGTAGPPTRTEWGLVWGNQSRRAESKHTTDPWIARDVL
jgi:hypothetical protein